MAHPCATDPELWFGYPDDDGSDGAAKARAYERSATQARIQCLRRCPLLQQRRCAQHAVEHHRGAPPPGCGRDRAEPDSAGDSHVDTGVALGWPWACASRSNHAHGGRFDDDVGHDSSHSTVGEGGLEPPRPEGHWHLKPARLPFRHSPATTGGPYHCSSGRPHPLPGAPAGSVGVAGPFRSLTLSRYHD